MDSYMITRTQEVSQEFLGATIEAVRKQSKGTAPWIMAITGHLTTPELTLGDLNMKSFSLQEIKEAQLKDTTISQVMHPGNVPWR